MICMLSVLPVTLSTFQPVGPCSRLPAFLSVSPPVNKSAQQPFFQFVRLSVIVCTPSFLSPAFLFVCSPAFQSICSAARKSVPPFFCHFAPPVSLTPQLSVSLPACLQVCPPAIHPWMPVYKATLQSFCQFASLSACHPVFLSVCPPVCHPVILAVCPPVFPPRFRQSARLSVFLPFNLHFACPSIWGSACPPTFSLVCPAVWKSALQPFV